MRHDFCGLVLKTRVWQFSDEALFNRVHRGLKKAELVHILWLPAKTGVFSSRSVPFHVAFCSAGGKKTKEELEARLQSGQSWMEGQGSELEGPEPAVHVGSRPCVHRSPHGRGHPTGGAECLRRAKV